MKIRADFDGHQLPLYFEPLINDPSMIVVWDRKHNYGYYNITRFNNGDFDRDWVRGFAAGQGMKATF